MFQYIWDVAVPTFTLHHGTRQVSFASLLCVIWLVDMQWRLCRVLEVVSDAKTWFPWCQRIVVHLQRHRYGPFSFSGVEPWRCKYVDNKCCIFYFKTRPMTTACVSLMLNNGTAKTVAG